MIALYELHNQTLQPLPPGIPPQTQDAAGGVWIDMMSPTTQEEKEVEKWLGIDIPTKDEMREIEDASRFYTENSALYLTITVASATDTDHPINVPVTFVLTDKHLVTVRYANPRPFSGFVERCVKQSRPFINTMDIFLGLTEGVLDRVADLLELLQMRLDTISRSTFGLGADNTSDKSITPPSPSISLKEVVQQLGRHHYFSMRLRESLLTIGRMMAYLRLNMPKRTVTHPLATVLRTAQERAIENQLSAAMRNMERNAQSLVEYNTHVNQEINFLLDSTLGLINEQQNTIIKVFSIVAVLFLPPTVVGTLYGMNFKYMPELDWQLGYPFALSLMLLSGIIPYLIIRQKGWL